MRARTPPAPAPAPLTAAEVAALRRVPWIVEDWVDYSNEPATVGRWSRRRVTVAEGLAELALDRVEDAVERCWPHPLDGDEHDGLRARLVSGDAPQWADEERWLRVWHERRWPTP